MNRFAAVLHRNLLLPALLLLRGDRPPKAPRPDPGTVLPPAPVLRPIGTRYTKHVPGNGLDPRSRGRLMTYEVVNYHDDNGTPHEVVRCVHVGRVP